MIIPAVIVNHTADTTGADLMYLVLKILNIVVFKMNIKVKFYRGPFRVIFLSDSLSSPLLPCWFASNGH